LRLVKRTAAPWLAIEVFQQVAPTSICAGEAT